MPTKISRRTLFRLRLKDVASLVYEKDQPGESDGQPRRYIRPPGAIQNEVQFLSTCGKCGDCVGACPYGAIRSLTAVAGAAEGTPFLQPENDPCRWCEDMPCIQACGSGALSRDSNGIVPPISKAVFAQEKCLNNQGVLCDTCANYCPTGVNAIRMVGREVSFDLDKCTGCGLCAYHCEAEPAAFSISIRRASSLHVNKVPH